MNSPINRIKAQTTRSKVSFKANTLLLAAVLLLPSILPAQTAMEGKTGEEILAMVDKALFLESYTSTIRMETTEPGASGPKVMVIENQSRKENGSYLEITAPARSKGTRFLQLDGSLWMYNPKTGAGKAIRLSARDSFQGSAFSNADLGKSQYSDEYQAVLRGKENLVRADLENAECWVIESSAKTETAAYGRITMWVRVSDSMPLRMEYYAKSGLLYKRMDLKNIKQFTGITRPSVMTMESLDKAGTITTIKVEAMAASAVSPTVFNKNWLTR